MLNYMELLYSLISLLFSSIYCAQLLMITYSCDFFVTFSSKNEVCPLANPVISSFIFRFRALHHARRVVSRFFMLYCIVKCCLINGFECSSVKTIVCDFVLLFVSVTFLLLFSPKLCMFFYYNSMHHLIYISVLIIFLEQYMLIFHLFFC